MSIKHIQRIKRIKQRTAYEAKDLLAITLFSTYKHSYTIGDMITQNYSFYMLNDVDYYSKLKSVNIVNAK